jgi:5-methylcytosine-specific restriction endonuclease McrA
MNPHYHAVGTRAEHRCEYCHAPEAIFNFPFEVEHIVPPDRGGAQDESSLALACRACNLFKSNHVEAADNETRTTVRYDRGLQLAAVIWILSRWSPRRPEPSR